MLDDILDLFNRRNRKHETERAPTGRNAGRRFEIPFLDESDDDDERDRFHHEDDRRSSRHHSSNRSSRDDDWF